MSETMLTPAQQAVVENRGGSLLVSAAAGSGKTKVLVERLFRAILEDGRNVDDFLIITYTKAAAAELRGKIAAELSRRLAERPGDGHLRRQLLRVYQADIRTVDAFCTALLRENAHLLVREGERDSLNADFRVLDDSEALLLRRRVLDRVLESFYDGLDERGAALADTLGAGRDDSSLAKLVLELYDKLQSHAYPDRWLAAQRENWEGIGDDFDATPYAPVLLTAVRRTAGHWAALLGDAADGMRGDLARGYGEKFSEAAETLSALEAAAGAWDSARTAAEAVAFPRLTTPKGRAEDPDVLRLKKLWEGCKAAVKEIRARLSVSGAEAMEDLRAVAPAMDALLRLTGEFAAAYRREKLRQGTADFSDQEHLALQLLTDGAGRPTELGRQISARYQEVLVDEYQDTNEVQDHIFRAVSREGRNLFTVGDVKQSIYRFRLADPGIFLGKYARYPAASEAADGEPRKILLSKNFRSRREILDAANFLFENLLSPEMGGMAYGSEESLHFGADYYPPREDCATEFHLLSVASRTAENEEPVKRLTAEARLTARRIRELLDGGFPVTGPDGRLRPCRPEDIVILMRAPGSRTAAFAQALAERNIPCSFEESGDFFHTMEVSVAVGLLRLIDNPRQDVPLISVLRSPIFGFSPSRLAELRGAAPEGDFYHVVESDPGEDCRAFLETLAALRSAARDMSVERLLWHCYNTLNILGVFGAMDGGTVRRENLIALTSHAARFEQGGYRGVFAFVTQLQRLMEEGKTPQTKGQAAVSGVRLMSIHRSKGLEFPIVILADLDHSFSRQDLDTPVLVHPTLGLGPIRVELERRIKYPTLARQAVRETVWRENLEEEQRILYVAVTRPKEKLILVDALYHAETRLQRLAAKAACPVAPETVSEGKSFGDWILSALLCRSEAAPLRTLAGVEVERLYDGDTSGWQVFCHDSEEFRAGPFLTVPDEAPAEEAAAFEPGLLEFSYPYRRETLLPEKVTATQLKGRAADEEIAENTARPLRLRPLTQPGFSRKTRGLTPAERGTATHLVLQYLDFRNRDAAAQVAALRRRAMLTDQQAAAVDTVALERFLDAPLAEEIRRSKEVLREYRFTLLVDAAALDPAATAGDQVLLQGVVDCCFVSEGGLTVVDFKTDRVSGGADTQARAERYRPQITAYSQALERVLERPVARRVLYFLATGETVEIK